MKSDAIVYWIGDQCKSHAFGIGRPGDGDYSKTVRQSERTVKATQKAIDTQHAAVFTSDVVAALVAEAKAHYTTCTEVTASATDPEAVLA